MPVMLIFLRTHTVAQAFSMNMKGNTAICVTTHQNKVMIQNHATHQNQVMIQIKQHIKTSL